MPGAAAAQQWGRSVVTILNFRGVRQEIAQGITLDSSLSHHIHALGDDGVARKGIRMFIFRVAIVALDPVPVNLMEVCQGIQPQP